MVVRSVSSAVCTGGQARRGRSGSVARAASASPQRRASVARRGSTAQAPASSPAAASSPVKALALDAKHAAQAEAERPQRPFRKVLGKLLAFLDQTWLQTLQYIVFLIAFQSLTGTIRKPDEFYFDKYLTDTFISSPFDADHNRFGDVRRIADIWEWQRTVLTPGLFSNAPEGEAMPDGDGIFSSANATPLSTAQLVELNNVVSFTQGIVFKQVRAEVSSGAHCYANHSCYDFGVGTGDTQPYGYGPSAGAFTWWSSEDLGANPEGVSSASQLSYRSFSSGGYVALFLPFFSEVYLPEESGSHADVRDYRLTEATPTNGKAPTYYCARSSFNGHHIEQRCNPDPMRNDATVRSMMDEMLTLLKRGHWIDHRTRLFSITMQMRNNNAGVRFIVRYMFEITPMGAVLPSYDMETMIDDADNTEEMRMWMYISLGLTIWFALLEGVEMAQNGLISYFTNLWNVMDWSNFALFGMVYFTLQRTLELNERDKGGENCIARICTEFGFYDMWQVFDTARNAKFFMSICVCIQLLKIIKFTNVIVPKMSLMTKVLAKGCYDLAFFGLIFGVSMFAFCMLFYIQLGSFMDDFYSQTASVIALAKALFGDFPFEEIIDNSRGYTNGILFLVYLFVAVFILLSMFLAILGEAQAAVRDDEAFLRERGEFPNQYGFLGEAKNLLSDKWARFKAQRIDHSSADDAAAAASHATEDTTPGLDQALNDALTRMQRKLDNCMRDRVSTLEGRLARQLAMIELQVSDADGGRSGRVPKRDGMAGSSVRSASRGGVDGLGHEGVQRSKSESPTKLRLVRQSSHERDRAGRQGSDSYKLTADPRSTRSRGGGAETSSGRTDIECKRPLTRSATTMGRVQRKPTTGIAKSRGAGAGAPSGADGNRRGPSRQNSADQLIC